MDLIVHELKTNIPANGKSEKRLALAEETTDDQSSKATFNGLSTTDEKESEAKKVESQPQKDREDDIATSIQKTQEAIKQADQKIENEGSEKKLAEKTDTKTEDSVKNSME